MTPVLALNEARAESLAPVKASLSTPTAPRVLGVPTKRFTSWLANRNRILADGGEPGGVLAHMSNPLARVNGVAVWNLADIERIRRGVGELIGRVGRPRKNAAQAEDSGD